MNIQARAKNKLLAKMLKTFLFALSQVVERDQCQVKSLNVHCCVTLIHVLTLIRAKRKYKATSHH